jgi:vacuolar-type H+-ATPase subunit F/Vma7
MTHVVKVMARKELGAGFALAGLRPVDAPEGTDIAPLLREAIDQPENGVLLVEDSCHARLPEDLLRLIGRRPLPMVVPFPGPNWSRPVAGAEEYIIELLRQVIGYRVRLR